MSVNLLTEELKNFIFTHNDLEEKLHSEKQVGFIERPIVIREMDYYKSGHDSLCKILSGIKLLGEGAFGKVYKTKHKTPQIAVKEFVYRHFEEYIDVDIATRFSHSCLVKNFL